jgi:hypothetical protein
MKGLALSGGFLMPKNCADIIPEPQICQEKN